MSDDKAEEIKKNILSPYQWVRILYMAFYAVACWVLLFVLPVIIICQVIISLITGDDNRNLRDFGKSLSDYFHQAMNYLVYATDEKAWPFSDGEDLGATFSNDSDDDDDDDDEDEDVSARDRSPPRPQSASAGTGADDVFSDISFTGDEPSDDVDADDNHDKRDPA